MSIGLIGKKIGMTREFFDSGVSVPVTVLSIEKGRIIDLIEQKALQISKTTEEAHFERLYDDTLETYYKKSTGNRKLQMPCTFCDYKFSCWKGLRYAKNPVSKAGNYEYYTQMANRYETSVS